MPHPKYGDKYTCFECGTKFYTMHKPEPLCPKCGANQKKAPKKASTRTPKAPIVVEDFENEEDTGAEDMEEDFSLGDEDETFVSDNDNLLDEDVEEEEY